MNGRGVHEEGRGDDEQEDSDRPRVESVLLEQRRAEENRVEQDRRGTEESPGARVPRIRDELDREQEYSDGPEGDPEWVRSLSRADVRDGRDEEEPGANREPDRREGVHVGARGPRYFKRSSRGLPPTGVPEPGDHPLLVPGLEKFGEAAADRMMQRLMREDVDHHVRPITLGRAESAGIRVAEIPKVDRGRAAVDSRGSIGRPERHRGAEESGAFGPRNPVQLERRNLGSQEVEEPPDPSIAERGERGR